MHISAELCQRFLQFPAEESFVDYKDGVKVLECLNQFGTNFSEIPAGWKTICKLDFYPEVPNKIDLLPSMSGWGFNRISFACLTAK
jgi:hypothetical protein